MPDYVPNFAIIGIDRIVNFLQDRGCIYWVVYDSDRVNSRNKIADNLQFEKEDLDNSARRLRQFLSDYNESGLTAYLWAKEKANSTTGGFYTAIKIEAKGGGVAGIGYTPPPQVDVVGEVNKAIAAYKLELKLEALVAENNELRKEVVKETSIDRIAKTLEPYIGTIAKEFFRDKAAPIAVATTVANVGKTTKSQDENEEATDETIEAINVLQGDDPEFHLKLKKLAQLKISDPDTYKMAVGMLDTL